VSEDVNLELGLELEIGFVSCYPNVITLCSGIFYTANLSVCRLSSLLRAPYSAG